MDTFLEKRARFIKRGLSKTRRFLTEKSECSYSGKEILRRVKSLISEGRDLDIPEYCDGRTALHLAVIYDDKESKEIVKLLIDYIKNKTLLL